MVHTDKAMAKRGAISLRLPAIWVTLANADGAVGWLYLLDDRWGGASFRTAMPAFKNTLSSNEIWAVIAYVPDACKMSLSARRFCAGEQIKEFCGNFALPSLACCLTQVAELLFDIVMGCLHGRKASSSFTRD